ncbi:transcriptional modulator of maze/toxin, mazf [hydrocarbon metagenome]|uniref:Transcriptional modulator of maze/toxin, mazf n=1 Tax=hydrocarbon metagenome TaxID=938273 RepID=A0A0W8G3C8_9ZZZZ
MALAIFPNTDGLTAKLRPVVIVQADGLDTGLPQVLVAMVTSNLRRTGKTFRFFVAADSIPGRASGLLSDSVVMADCLATISLKAVHRIIGSLERAPLDVALRAALDLQKI